jgi:hypothetical protein
VPPDVDVPPVPPDVDVPPVPPDVDVPPVAVVPPVFVVPPVLRVPLEPAVPPELFAPLEPADPLRPAAPLAEPPAPGVESSSLPHPTTAPLTNKPSAKTVRRRMAPHVEPAASERNRRRIRG